MTSQFQQQTSAQSLNFTKAAPTPQHGRKPHKQVLNRPDPRAVAGQPGPH